FTPPPRVFPVAWTTLYASTALAAWRVLGTPRSRARTAALTAWGAHLGLNALWSVLFFGKRRPKLALAELGAYLAASGAFTYYTFKVDRTAGLLAAPLTGWLTLAGAVNAEIVRRN